MTVILIGDGRYPELEFVAAAVEDLGASAVMWDIRDWPGETPATYTPSEPDFVAGDEISIDDVSGVFALQQTVFSPLHHLYYDWYDGDTTYPRVINQLREWRSLFNSIQTVCERTGATVIPGVEAFGWNLVRPWMLERYHQAGVPVPETLFTNEPTRVKEFVADHGTVVYQYVNGGVKPRTVTTEDLEDRRLEKLRAAPVQFQEYVPGDDVRVYVVEGAIVGAFKYLYEGDAFSFKHADEETWDAERFHLPDAVHEAVMNAASVTPGSFAAIDVRFKNTDRYAILEANLPGRFAGSDGAGVTDVAGALADQLV